MASSYEKELLIEGHEHICRPFKILDGYSDICQHCKKRIIGKHLDSAYGCQDCEYFLHKSCLNSDSVFKFIPEEFDKLMKPVLKLPSYFRPPLELPPSVRCPQCSRRIPDELGFECKFCCTGEEEFKPNSNSNPNARVESLLKKMSLPPQDTHDDGVDRNKFKYAPCGKETMVWTLCDDYNHNMEEDNDQDDSSGSCCRVCNSLFASGGHRRKGIDKVAEYAYEFFLSDNVVCPVCLDLLWVDEDLLSCKEEEVCGFVLKRAHNDCMPPMPTLKFEYQQHQLFLVKNKLKLLQTLTNQDPGCNKCGKTGDDMIFKCLIQECTYYVHVHCAPFVLPVSTKHENHYDRLTFADANSFVDEGQDGFYYCDLCQDDRDPTASVYRCDECNFNAHTYCALYDKQLPALIAEWMSISAKTETDVSYKERQQSALFECRQSIQGSIERSSTQLDDITKQLMRVEGIYSSYIASSSSSATKEEEIFANNKKQQIQHPLHPHPLSLHLDVTSPYSTRFDSTWCVFCRRKANDKLHDEYRCCIGCNFRLHVSCGCANSLPPKLNKIQLGGEHLLFQVEKPSHFLWRSKCKICDQKLGDGHGNSPIFVCVVPECRDALHLHCLPLTFPDKVKHRDHPYHDLVYTNPVIIVEGEEEQEGEEEEECYCDDQSCEQRRSPNFPFYYCEECNFSAHITCCISEELPSMFEEHEKNGAASLDPFLVKFEQDFIFYRSWKEQARANLQIHQESMEVVTAKLAQIK